MNQRDNDRGLPPQPLRFIVWLAVAGVVAGLSRFLMLAVILPVAWVGKAAGAFPAATFLGIVLGWLIVPLAMIRLSLRARGLRSALWLVYAATSVVWVGQVLLGSLGIPVWSGHTIYAGQDFGLLGVLTPAAALAAALAYAWFRWGVPVPRRRTEQALQPDASRAGR